MNKAEKDRRRKEAEQAKLRKRRQRERNAAALRDRLAATHVTPVTEPVVGVTPEPVTEPVPVVEPVTSLVTLPVTLPEDVTPVPEPVPDLVVTPQSEMSDTGHLALPKPVASWQLIALAYGALAVGLVNNISFALSQGDSPQTQMVFAAMTVVNDGAAFYLLDQTKRLWSGRSHVRSVVCLLLYLFTLGFALNSSLGFASLSISNVTTARAERQSPALALAQRKLDTLSKSRADECNDPPKAKSGTGRGPKCRDLEAQEQVAIDAVSAVQATLAAGADPQIEQASKLVSWWTRDKLAPTGGDFSMLRLTFLTVLPQLGGLLLMVARR